MDRTTENLNPYAVLGVPPSASRKEIRAAYRKAALLHHPDKAQAANKEAAHEQFAKISAAYEVLTDPSVSSAPKSSSNEEPYASQQAYSTSTYHDPFSVFESVFREEFGGSSRDIGAFGFPFFAASRPFERMMAHRDRDPFMKRHLAYFGSDPFGDDDFFSGHSRFFGHPSPFESIFGDLHRHDDMISSRRRREDTLPSSDLKNHFYSSSSSSSSSIRQKNGETVTTTETTRIGNGKKQHVKEIVTLAADGSVKDRQVTGDDSLLLRPAHDNTNPKSPLEPHHHHWLHLPWWHRKNVIEDDGPEKHNEGEKKEKKKRSRL